MNNNLRQQKNNIYRLKRQYGKPITVWRSNDDQVVDFETGLVAETHAAYRVAKAIVLPKTIKRSLVQDLAFIAANRNFTAGGYFEAKGQTMLVDQDDLPITLNTNDFVQYRDQQYVIAELLDTEVSRLVAVRLSTISSLPVVGKGAFSKNSLTFAGSVLGVLA